ncbi:MAG: RraA family protein [Spirochaetales bacterium]|nr:RraA family protein [Spirochaetales bacterium]
MAICDRSDRKDLLKAYEDLRVADVRDGMDTMLHHGSGSMNPAIRPLFRTRAFGIARTCRYLPYQGTVPELSPEEYWQWTSRYYEEICPYPWIEDIAEGDFIVIDQSGVDAGLMGSDNTLNCLRKGARGFVTSGGVRDTDEIIRQKIPFFSAMISQSMVQGRLQFDAKDLPVSVGGVAVFPGDVVVADGDGVIVVPRKMAAAVAEHAHAEHQRDKLRRAAHYESLGWDLDSTVT